MQLKLYKQKINFRQTQVLLFHKRYVNPFPRGPDNEPLSCRILIGVVCV